MPYSLEVIQKTLASEYGVRVSKPNLKIALELPQWVPDIGRMIAVGNRPAEIDTSTRYGVFTGMVGDEYQIESGSTWNSARLLRADEIAKCY